MIKYDTESNSIHVNTTTQTKAHQELILGLQETLERISLVFIYSNIRTLFKSNQVLTWIMNMIPRNSDSGQVQK